MREFNPKVWFGERELFHVPPHFVKCETPVTPETIQWIECTLIGRYALSSFSESDTFFWDSKQYIYFEDPKEAMMYELRWSGQTENNLLY